jgi:TolA-binding protein
MLLAGCGQDEYAMEREYYHVQKQASDIMTNPDAVPPLELKRVVEALQGFMTKYPGKKIALDAEFTIARMYAAVKDYDKAQDELIKIRKTYNKSDDVGAEAVFTRGVIYEDAKDWNAALEQYQFLTKSYPRTARGLEAPLYIAMRYKSKFQADKMMESLREAVTYYQGLAQQVPMSGLGFQARMMVAQCYSELKDWDSAVKTLEGMIQDFKGKVQTDRIMLDVASIYATQLKDPAKARAVLDQVIKDNPKAGSAKTAKAMLSQMEKEKK